VPNDPLYYFDPPAVVESVDDPSLCFRPESDATVSEFADDGGRVSGDDAAEQKRVPVAEAGSEGSTIDPIVLEALRNELKEIQAIKDSVAAASALRSEMDSLSARVIPLGVEFSRVQETARAALDRGATVEKRLLALESRLAPLGDLTDVRREIEKRFDALNALIQEVRASTDAVNRQQGRLERLAVEMTAQLQQRKQRDVEIGREMARSQSGQALPESAWRRVWEFIDRAALMANVRRRSLSMHLAEAMARLRVRKTVASINYVVVAVFTALVLTSAFLLHSVWRTAGPVGPPVGTAPVPSTAVPSATSAITKSDGAVDSATTVQSLTRTRQAAAADIEAPATRRATEFVGTLSIGSTPDKAEVHIDRERVGETPLVLQRLRAGSHAIWIDHEGYQRWTAGVNVRAGELTRVTPTLQAESPEGKPQ
jgi:PEGA domain